MNIYAFVLTPWFWLGLTVVFLLIELACSFNLVTIWFAISSFLMVFITGFVKIPDMAIRFRLHLGIFLGLAIVLLIFTRPVAIRKLKIGKTKTNVDSILEQHAIVTKKITRFEKGEIRVQGKYWTAVSETSVSENQALKAGDEFNEGEECVIVRIEGVKAVVRKP